MNAADDLWRAVHGALDARRDPLDDARVLAALERAPECLGELAALRAGLRTLPRGAAPAPRRRRMPLLLVASTALLLLVGFWPRPATLTPPPITASVPAAPAFGAVLLASASSERRMAMTPMAGVLDHRQLLTIHRP